MVLSAYVSKHDSGGDLSHVVRPKAFVGGPFGLRRGAAVLAVHGAVAFVSYGDFVVFFSVTCVKVLTCQETLQAALYPTATCVQRDAVEDVYCIAAV